MATAAPQAQAIVPWSWRPLYRLSVDQYHRMIEAGVLMSGDRIELLEGLLVTKRTTYPPHAQAVTRINRLLVKLLPDAWRVRVQCPITLQDSEPEPDFVIVAGPEERYNAAQPGPGDVALLIEAADSSLLHDRREKGRLYAEMKISDFWLVNLVESRVEAFTQPRARAGSYAQQRDYGTDEAVPLVLGGEEVARLPVRDLLPNTTST